MMELESIFRHKSPNGEKLISNGFIYSKGAYSKTFAVLCGQFHVRVRVSEKGNVDFRVYEAESGEEYILVRVPGAEGSFVGKVRGACEEVLTGVSEGCFDTVLFKARQTRALVGFMQENCGAQPEFLWKRYPDYAAFRVKENGKWFAVIMHVSRSRLGLPGPGSVEVINLKDTPQEVKRRLETDGFLRAYHMDGKNWYTVCLNDTVEDRQIEAQVSRSYALVRSKRR